MRAARECSTQEYTPLITEASLVGEHGLQGTQASVLQHVGLVATVPGLSSTGPTLAAPGLGSFDARGIFPDQGLKPCLLHW